jgi:F-type H+-transporting ATPase subunit delta
MSTETIARRYAVALADAVGTTGDTAAIRTELDQWSILFNANADLQNVFANPAIVHGNKAKVLDSLIEKAKPSRMTANFLKVLLQNGRLSDIGEISERFKQVLEERSGVVSAQITSAREISAAERQEFETSLARLTGKKVTVAYQIDPELIGGAVTRIGSTVYDGSVRTKLENLKTELIGA